MAVSLVQKLRCLFGHHKRSRGQAYDDGGQMLSVCRYCGIGMRRTKGKWLVHDRAADPPPT